MTPQAKAVDVLNSIGRAQCVGRIHEIPTLEDSSFAWDCEHCGYELQFWACHICQQIYDWEPECFHCDKPNNGPGCVGEDLW